jgi:hypothetical protein
MSLPGWVSGPQASVFQPGPSARDGTPLVTPSWCPGMPAGVCRKASMMCRRGFEQPWCGILTRCLRCHVV